MANTVYLDMAFDCKNYEGGKEKFLSDFFDIVDEEQASAKEAPLESIPKDVFKEAFNRIKSSRLFELGGINQARTTIEDNICWITHYGSGWLQSIEDSDAFGIYHAQGRGNCSEAFIFFAALGVDVRVPFAVDESGEWAEMDYRYFFDQELQQPTMERGEYIELDEGLSTEDIIKILRQYNCGDISLQEYLDTTQHTVAQELLIRTLLELKESREEGE